MTSSVTAMLEARSIALVGASARPGSLGARMVAEVARSPSRPRTYLVNPRYADIGGTPCLPGLAEVPEPVDLVLLAVPDTALEPQLSAAARRQDRSAVIFGNAFDPPGKNGLRDRLAAIAAKAGMAVCGAGCMGFVNVARGLRAVGYVEPDPVPAVRARPARTRAAALAAAAEIGYPVVIRTDEPHIAHKSDVGGVCLGLAGPEAVGAAYDDLAARLGPRVLVCQTAAPGTELALGLIHDPALGPLLVIGTRGVLIEILAERSVVLPPVTRCAALALTSRLRLAAVLAGSRGQPPADLGAVADAITALSALACELGDVLAALDINPLICGPSGAVAADVLAVPLRSSPSGR